jgi:hypothetical protein
MRIFLDSGKYKVQINSSASRTYTLEDQYKNEVKPEAEGKAVEQKSFKDFYENRVKEFNFIFRNGCDLEGKKWTVQDMYSVPDAPVLLPRVISTLVREAVEPMLIGTTLLQRINYTMGQTILLPATGGLSVGDLDIPEGGEYPEAKMDRGGSAMVANIGKSGIAVKVTEEMIRYSQVDVIGLHLRAAGRCLARHKEVKIFNMIGSMGTVFYDNKSPKTSMLGVTHGRGFNGAANGSLVADDIFDCWGHIMARGFMANTVIVHPLMYLHFLKDPNLRAFAFAAGGGVQYATWTGSPLGGNPWQQAAGGLAGPGKTEKVSPDTPVELRNQLITSAPVLPSYLNVPFTVIVTPFMRYDAIKKQTDVLIVDKNELGVILVDEDPTTEEWNDPARDIRKVKIRERYCLGILNEGQNAGIIKNVVNVANRISMDPAQARIPVAALKADGTATTSGGMEEIPVRTPVAL